MLLLSHKGHFSALEVIKTMHADSSSHREQEVLPWNMLLSGRTITWYSLGTKSSAASEAPYGKDRHSHAELSVAASFDGFSRNDFISSEPIATHSYLWLRGLWVLKIKNC